MLPVEIYVKLFESLDYQSLLKCMQVCSLFRELIDDTAALQYIIELAAAGQKDGSKVSNTTSASQLEALKKHQSSWGSLKWSRELLIPMEDGSLWELYGGVLAQSTADGTLIFVQLPSDLRSIDEKVWTLADLGVLVGDFGMDPSQDLLVLIERPNWHAAEGARRHSLHLRSLLDGKPHSLSRDAPVLFHSQGDRGRFNVSYDIQISGTFLAVYFCSDDSDEDASNELCIWNWMTGELQVNVHGNDIRSFSFLSNTHVILATFDEAGYPQLVVMNFQQESSESHHFEDLQYATTFFYPEFAIHNSHFHNIDIRTDPGPPWRPNGKLQVPFFQDTSHALFIVSLWIYIDGGMQCLTQFIPSASLTSLIENETTGLYYEWEEWGLHGSRLLFPSKLPSSVWVCYVHGLKYVALEPGASQEGLVARLYDFNQMAIKRNCADVDGWLCNRAGTVLVPGIFDDLVETTLPYRSQVLYMKDVHDHCLALCSEDHVIIVDPECKEYRILIF